MHRRQRSSRGNRSETVMYAVKATIVALVLCLASAVAAQRAAAQVAVPPLSGRVVDQTGTLSRDQVAALETTLKDFEARKGSQIAVLMVPTTAPEAIEQFSIRVAEAWKIGRNKIDDGAILVIAKNDRALRIEVGYGLEGVLPDVIANRILDEVIKPRLRDGDFAGGISAGVDRIVSVIDGEPLPAPVRQRQRSSGFDDIGPLNPFVIFAVIIVGGVLRGMLGRLIGSLATGGLVAALFWWIAASLFLSGIAGLVAFLFTMFSDSIMSSGGRGGGFVGGGGSFSSGSSDGGGFRGGGGRFGGGGASGSW
jgi:uncharacterized protein